MSRTKSKGLGSRNGECSFAQHTRRHLLFVATNHMDPDGAAESQGPTKFLQQTRPINRLFFVLKICSLQHHQLNIFDHLICHGEKT